MKFWLLGALALGLGTAVLAADEAPVYKLLSSTALPGDGGWDFLSVESASRRLYVTHTDSVQVLDADSLKLLGTVADVKRPHGVVALPELGKGFVSSGDPGSVVVFDLKSFQKLQEIPTSKDCDVIFYDSASARVFTFNGDSKNATAIDPKSLKVVGTIDLGGEPEVGVADAKGLIYDNLASTGEILVINAKALKVTQRWKLAHGQSPTGLALDAEHGRLFVGCRNKTLVILDAKNGKELQTLPIGEHIDSTAFDAKAGVVFNSCGDGTMSMALRKGAAYQVLTPLSTTAGARTMALDPVTGDVYTVAAQRLPDDPKARKEAHRWSFAPGSFRVYQYGR
jgi:DNA-binding beta-propeller fold protein YncE